MTKLASLVIAGVAMVTTACNKPRAAPEPAASASVAVPSTAAPAAVVPPSAPSFECNRPLPAADAAVCTDGNLAQLDIELDRLYRLVDSRLADAERQTLSRLHTGWKQKRDACPDNAGIKACLTHAYAARIADIRAGYAVARDDKAGISVGPVSWRCPGASSLLSSTYINSSLPLVRLQRENMILVLGGAAAASGARYRAATPDGEYEFWTKGAEATFTVPGSDSVTCTQSENAKG